MDVAPYPGSVLAEEAPKITDWMQAWGSLAGLVMSTFAVIFTGLLFRHEIRVRREEQRDSEAAQARLVLTTFMGLGRGSSKDSMYTVAKVRVNNFSDVPVLDVRVCHTSLNGELTIPEKMPVLAGEVNLDLWLREPLPGLDGELVAKDVTTQISFTDVNGHRWNRVGSERPVRILPAVDPSVSRRKAKLVGALSFLLGIALALFTNYLLA